MKVPGRKWNETVGRKTLHENTREAEQAPAGDDRKAASEE